MLQPDGCGNFAVLKPFPFASGIGDRWKLRSSAMTSSQRPNVRLDISFSRNAWQVTIFHGSNSEHKSFRTEAEARDYGRARMESLQMSGTDKVEAKPQ
jgi:hypothetical protein